jgi:hypothetical protein
MVAFAHFADAGAGAVFIEQAADAADPMQVFGLVLGKQMVLHAVGVGFDIRFHAVIGRVIAQEFVVEEVVDGIEAEAINTPVEPEAHVGEVVILHVRVVKVHVRLADKEVVQIVLLAPGIPLPGRAAKDGKPVVGGGAVVAGVGPDIPIGFGVLAAGAAFDEGGVFVRGVVEDLINDDLQAKVMGAGNHDVEIGEGAEDGVDIGIVGHVIAHIGHGRAEEGGKPDGIDAQGGNVVEASGDTGQIADAIAICILKGPGIDLIHHRPAPPILHSALHFWAA